jgi:adenine-specific DNA-methyltransferase
MKPRSKGQPSLFDESDAQPESSDYLTQQLLTYLGNKRSLLAPIEDAVRSVRREFGGRKLVLLDGFSGSGVVSRLLKRHATKIIANDLEDYATVVSRCYLANASEVPIDEISLAVSRMNKEVGRGSAPPHPGFIQHLYSPADDSDIQPGERVFYTSDNGRRLDHFRQLIDGERPEIKDFLLGPLLSEASIHTNTAGVFKGFYKDKETGIGRFGGNGRDSLGRIKGAIMMRVPVLSLHECESQVISGEINDVVRRLDEVDLAYFDPPYNQHPYGSNYFMLNLITNYRAPDDISIVSGIPKDWKRSGFNVRRQSIEQMRDLIQATPAKFLLVSFNDEGFITPEEMRRALVDKGQVQEIQLRYNTFRGSRNLSGRRSHVTEHLYLVKCRE